MSVELRSTAINEDTVGSGARIFVDLLVPRPGDSKVSSTTLTPGHSSEKCFPPCYKMSAFPLAVFPYMPNTIHFPETHCVEYTSKCYQSCMFQSGRVPAVSTVSAVGEGKSLLYLSKWTEAYTQLAARLRP